ncbi:hypothetical protein GSI_04113 [Ganoderma sinense ZZ0214-1]|uniref:Uncharacterized protein n=1 Tax=Ganoderma sinense ZZ0214-1 TaxID=1077348 RepID=A0A2G8SIA8_9APHY|nr:hypothetical protein GSI_04113 [Ganoderma sinense ZZ0214-1]
MVAGSGVVKDGAVDTGEDMGLHRRCNASDDTDNVSPSASACRLTVKCIEADLVCPAYNTSSRYLGPRRHPQLYDRGLQPVERGSHSSTVLLRLYQNNDFLHEMPLISDAANRLLEQLFRRIYLRRIL